MIVPAEPVAFEDLLVLEPRLAEVERLARGCCLDELGWRRELDRLVGRRRGWPRSSGGAVEPVQVAELLRRQRQEERALLGLMRDELAAGKALLWPESSRQLALRHLEELLPSSCWGCHRYAS